VVAQFLLHDGIEHVWEATEEGRPAEGGDVSLAYVHVATGVTILLLALARLWLRATRGVPDEPPSNPAIMRQAARINHYLLYGLIVAMPLAGAAAWFFGIENAARLHSFAATVLFWLAAIHIAGALVEHFVMKTNVLKRMLGQA
jgi:cytochrome b561